MENKKNICEECKYETTCNIDGLEDECCFEERHYDTIEQIKPDQLG